MQPCEATDRDLPRGGMMTTAGIRTPEASGTGARIDTDRYTVADTGEEEHRPSTTGEACHAEEGDDIAGDACLCTIQLHAPALGKIWHDDPTVTTHGCPLRHVRYELRERTGGDRAPFGTACRTYYALRILSEGVRGVDACVLPDVARRIEDAIALLLSCAAHAVLPSTAQEIWEEMREADGADKNSSPVWGRI